MAAASNRRMMCCLDPATLTCYHPLLDQGARAEVGTISHHSQASLLLTCLYRRALLARKRMLQVETTSFQSKCPDTGVDFRVFFDFDGDYDWFSKRVTDVIPGM